MSCIFFRKIFNILFLAAVVLWACTQQPSQGQTTGSTQTSGTTSSGSTELYNFFGTVVQENEAPPPIGTAIELDCQDTITRVADVGPTGQYTFQLGDPDRMKKLQPDASIGNDDGPFGAQAAANQAAAQSQSSSSAQSSAPSTQAPLELSISAKLMLCSLRAQAPGYRSSVIKLQGMVFSQQNKLDAIKIYPLNSDASLVIPKKAKKLMDQAMKAYKKEDLKGSETLFKSAVAEYPNYSEAWLQLGLLYQKQKRDPEARIALEKAIAIDKSCAAAYVQLGWIAMREATEAIKKEPKKAEAKWKEVAKVSERAIKLYPSSFPEAYYLSALANLNLKDAVLAEKRARTMKQYDTGHRFPQISLILAYIMMQYEDYAGAAEEFRNYLRYAPKADDADVALKKLQECEKKMVKTASPK
jgi:tetratricopeptide (TPR) repeat protein